MKQFFASFFVLLFCSSISVNFASAQGFEGAITFSASSKMFGIGKMMMVYSTKGSHVVIDQYVDGPVEAGMPADHSFIYLDRVEKSIVVVHDATHGTKLALPDEPAYSTSDDSALPPATGRTDMINGYKATEYVDSSGIRYEGLWVTADLPANVRNAIDQLIPESAPNSNSKLFRALAKRGLAPVRVIEGTGQRQAIVDLVKFDTKHVDDALFIVPPAVKIDVE